MMRRDSKLIKVICIIVTLILMVPYLALLRLTFRQKIACLSSEPYIYTKTELSFYDGDEKIYGVIYRPSGVTGRQPVIIMSHGLYGSADLWDRTASSFAESGLTCYCFDFRNANTLGRSSGTDLLSMSLMTEKADLDIVIQNILKQDFTDLDNLFLMGESLGGAVTAVTAPDFADQIKGVILYYPAFNLVENAREEFPTIDDIPATYRLMWQKVGKKFFEDIYDLDIYGTAAKYTGPVLIIHGTSDQIVDISFSKKAIRYYKDSKLIILDKEIHGFTNKGKETAASDSYDFLESLISGK